MTEADLRALFVKHEDEYLKYDRIPNMRSSYKDICAMQILEQCVPKGYTIIEHAEHEKIWFSPYPEEVAKVIDEADVITLIRCGVQLDEELFTMSV